MDSTGLLESFMGRIPDTCGGSTVSLHLGAAVREPGTLWQHELSLTLLDLHLIPDLVEHLQRSIGDRDVQFGGHPLEAFESA